jgi:superoxide reductase
MTTIGKRSSPHLEEVSMERRAFLNSALVGGAGIAFLPSVVKASATPDLENIVFTESDPGHWKDVEKLHVPEVKLSGDKITVTTPHPMSEAHHIVSHTVVLEGGKFLSRKTFTWKDKPVSEHTLPPGYKGMISVTSTCNLHDWWLKTLTV